MFRTIALIFISSVLIFAGCKTNEKIGVQNLSYLYNKADNTIHPQATSYSINDSTIQVQYRFLTNEMLFTRADPDSPFFSNYSVCMRLFSTLDTRMIHDSATRYFSLNAKDTSQWIKGSGEIRAHLGSDYLLEVRVNDLNRNQFSKTYLFVYRKLAGGSQDYQIKLNNELSFTKYYNQGDKLSVQYCKPVSKLFLVNYFKDEFPIATPPFSSFIEKATVPSPDSSFWAGSDNDGSFSLTLNKKGIYQIHADTSVANCLNIPVFYPGYPEIVKPENMLPPLRYLTTKQEYEKMDLQLNKKAAVDNFWIDCAGNLNRAKTMIRNYYSRVQSCNEFFTNHTEGWKSDRGMIYLVFGPPNILYKSPDSENWIYGEENNAQSMSFVFVRSNSAFSENEYILSRNPIYKYNWYNSVEMWRR
ncbi:MAG: GWxTD domain-containing protein [Bacteroidota bacterium]